MSMPSAIQMLLWPGSTWSRIDCQVPGLKRCWRQKKSTGLPSTRR